MCFRKAIWDDRAHPIGAASEHTIVGWDKDHRDDIRTMPQDAIDAIEEEEKNMISLIPTRLR